MIRWADAEVRVEPDGSILRLMREGNLVVEISWVGARGDQPALVTDDEIEHNLETGVGKLLQRSAVNRDWRNRWVMIGDPERSVEVTGRLRVRPGPEYALWSWGSGVTAVFTVAPAHAAGPVLGFRLEQGYLEPVADRSPRVGLDYLVAPSGTSLAAGARMVTVLAGQWYREISEFETEMPSWTLETQLDEGETWWGDLADVGVSVPEGLQLGFSDGKVSVDGPVGCHVVDITGPRGLSRVALEWVPQIEAVLHPLVARMLDSGRDLSVAEGLCLQLAADRNTVWLDPAAHNLLDQVNWEPDDSPLAAAFALARGRSLGEAALISDALRRLGRQPAGVGYGRVVMAAFLASLSVGLDSQTRCLEMLGRPAVGRTAALESSLLHYRSADLGGPGLAGVANRLGGLLPGEAPLLAWSDFAQLIGLLELCPPEWAHASYYAQVASKAKGHLLCAYVDGRVTEAGPLAWLLLTPELSPAA